MCGEHESRRGICGRKKKLKGSGRENKVTGEEKINTAFSGI